ncbi:MAG: hypothetical protein AAGA25_15030 [Planctomycetota bacterium]
MPLCLAIAGALFAVHPQVTQINFARVIEVARQPYTMMQISLVLICEGLLVIWACHHAGQARAAGGAALAWPGEARIARLLRGVHKIGQCAVYLPSPALLLGLALMQSWLFHQLSSMPFARIALLQSLAVFFVLVGLAILCRWVLPRRDQRIEVRFLMAMVQLGLAVFLPMWGDGAMESVNAYAVDLTSSVVVWAGLIALALVGLGMSQYKIKRGRIAKG